MICPLNFFQLLEVFEFRRPHLETQDEESTLGKFRDKLRSILSTGMFITKEFDDIIAHARKIVPRNDLDELFSEKTQVMTQLYLIPFSKHETLNQKKKKKIGFN